MNLDLAPTQLGRSILALDDSATQSEALKYVLEKRGYAVTVARIVRDALARSKGCKPGLVISLLFGGDEFAVLLTDCLGPAARAATDRLTANVNRLKAGRTRPYTLSLSLGLAQFDLNDQTGLHTLLEQGDADMYANKRRSTERGER